MAFKITDECISCGACEPECPNAAISEGENIYIIDPAKCTECIGSFTTKQCAEICPVDCCLPDEAHVESYDVLMAKWRKSHPGQEPKVK